MRDSLNSWRELNGSYEHGARGEMGQDVMQRLYFK